MVKISWKLVGKTLLNVLYGVIIFFSIFFTSSVGKTFIPQGWYIFFSVGFIVIQTVKNVRKKEPEKKERDGASSTL